MNKEKRDFHVELRADEANPRLLRGYAAMYNKRSLDLGGFVEVIKPGAFTRSLSGTDDVLALAHHNSEKVLGRRSAGTLKITEDQNGLAVEITAANTTAGNDIMEDVRVGNIKGMSFGFVTRKDTWAKPERADGPMLRELVDVDLHEVSAVTWPAYPDTSIALRSRPAEAVQQDLAAMKRLQNLRFRLLSIEV